MPDDGDIRWSRREFLRHALVAGTGTAAGLASGHLVAGLRGGLQQQIAAAEPLPEVATIRLTKIAALCLAPQYLAEDLLRKEGFTRVEYVPGPLGAIKAVASGEADMSMTFTGPLIIQVDAGDPIVILGGVHVGCFE